MKKYAVVLTLISLAAVVFTGCQNFLSGSKIQTEIQDMLDYQYADSIEIKFDLENDKGTAKTSLSMNKKPTDKFTVSFIPNSEYAFLGWEVECITTDSESHRSRLASELINGDLNGDEFFESIETKIEEMSGGVTLCTIEGKIQKTDVLKRINIKPTLEMRPVVNSSTPVYDPLLISRQTPITVTFSQMLDESNFRFTNEDLVNEGAMRKIKSTYELNEGYELLYDENGKPYAYKSPDGIVSFKNIEITTDSGMASVAESFNAPVLENVPDTKTASLMIQTNEDKLIEIGNAGYRTITVTLSKKIKNKNGVSLSEDYTWGYQVSEATMEKAEVDFYCNAEEGQLSDSLIAGKKRVNLGQQIPLNFTENADYQFIRWEFDTKYISVPNYKNISATAIIHTKTPENVVTVIKAVCAPRLKVTSITPLNTAEEPTAAKNSSIVIKFSNDLPTDEAGIAQNENIGIVIGGTTVKTCFDKPLLAGNKITFNALKENMIEVPDGQTKTVTVTVPGDMYYEYTYTSENTNLTEIYNITMGKDINANYKINSDTLNMTVVNFGTNLSLAGTITPEGSQKYSLNKNIHVKFELNDGYIFKGWTVTSGGKPVDSSIAVISSLTSQETDLTIKDASEAINVIANCSEMLRVIGLTVTDVDGKNGQTEADAVCKDTDIIVNFSQPLGNGCNLNDIEISADGSPCTKSFNDMTIKGNQILIKNTKRLSVNRDEIKAISVKIPKSFYYEKDEEKTYLQNDVILNYYISHKTKERITVNYFVVNGEDETILNTADNAGTLSAEGGVFYLDESQTVSFEAADDYQFYGWECSNTEALSLSSEKNSEISVKVLKGSTSEAAAIKAVVYRRPKVDAAKCLPLLVDGEMYAKDVPIEIVFDHALANADVLKKISMTYSGDNFRQKDYYKTTLSADRKTILITPINDKYLAIRKGHDSEEVTVTVPKDVYYYAKDGKTPITSSKTEDYIHTFTIENRTNNITTVKYNFESGTMSVDDDDSMSSGTASGLSNLQEVELEFTPSDASKRIEGWKVEAGGSYTVSPAGLKKSGQIVVNYNNKSYFTLTINSQNPNKATIKAIDYIPKSGGEEGYSVKITAKEYTVPTTLSCKPDSQANVVPSDTPVVIKFSKEMDENTLTLYNETDGTGNIQIVDATNSAVHYEDYFRTDTHDNVTWDAANKTLTLDPRTEIYTILGSFKTMDLKVIINNSQIFDTEGKQLEGAEEWVYRINQYTVEKVKFAFVYNESEFGQIRVNGTKINTGAYVVTSNESEGISIGQELLVEYLPRNEIDTTVTDKYAMSDWGLSDTDETYLNFEDETSYKTTITVKAPKVDGDGNLETILITPALYKIPEIASYQPVYEVNGVSNNENIVITFNKEMNTDSFALYDNTTKTGTVQIVAGASPDAHLEQYFQTIDSSCWSTVGGKQTLTIKTNSDIYKVLGSSNTFDIKVMLSSGCKDTDGNSLGGTTEWTYRINQTTSVKTTVEFDANAAESGWTVLINGEEYSSAGNANKFSMNQTVSIECVPRSNNYAFEKWAINNTTNPDENNQYITIANINASATTMTIKNCDNTSVTVYPIVYEIPVVTNADSLFKSAGEPFNKPIEIKFNKAMSSASLTDINAASLLNIKILNTNGMDEGWTSYFDASRTTLSVDGKTLTIYPKDTLFNILDTDKTKDFIIKLDASAIKDADTTQHNLGGTTTLNYRINRESNAKTKITFAANADSTEGWTVTVKDQSSDNFYSKNKEIEIECSPRSNAYAFNKWTVTSGIEYVAITEPSSSKTKVTVNSIPVNWETTTVTITPELYLIPKVATAPAYSDAGQPYNKAITIVFNKTMDTSKLNAFTNIKILNGTTNIANSTYFNTPSASTSNGITTLTITPKTALLDILGTEQTKDLTIQLDASAIKDNDTNKHNLTGTTSYTYRINRTTVSKTQIKFELDPDSASGWIVKVDGVQSTGASVEYSLGQVLNIECSPRTPGEYKLTKWTVQKQVTSNGTTTTTTGATEIQFENNDLTKTTLTINAIPSDPANTVILITPVLSQMPAVISSSPEYLIQGTNMDTHIQFTFNKSMSEDTIALYQEASDNSPSVEGNIEIVDSVYGYHYEKYFKTPYLSGDGISGHENTILTIRPDGSKIREMIPENQKVTFKVILKPNMKESVTSGTAHTLGEISPEGFTKTVCFNSARNTTKPSLTNFTLYMNEEKYNVDTSTNRTKQLKKYTVDNIENYQTETYSDQISVNHINKSVYISGFDCNDVYSGMKGVYVEETLVRKSDGTVCNIPVQINADGYGSTPGRATEVSIHEEEPSHYTASFTYDLQSQEDGIVKLVFHAINYADALSEQVYTYYVARDTQVNVANYYIQSDKTLTEYIDEVETAISNGEDVSNVKIITDAENVYFYVGTDKWGLNQEEKLRVVFYTPIPNNVNDAFGNRAEGVFWNSGNSHLEEIEETNGLTKYQLNPLVLIVDDEGLLAPGDVFDCENNYMLFGLEDTVGNRKEISYIIPRKGAVIDVQGTGTLTLEEDKSGYTDSSYTYTNHIWIKDSNGIKKWEYNDVTIGYTPQFSGISTPYELYSFKSYSFISPAGQEITFFGEVAKFNELKTYPGYLEDTEMKPEFTLKDIRLGAPGSSEIELNLEISNYLDINSRYTKFIVLTTQGTSFTYSEGHTPNSDTTYWNRTAKFEDIKDDNYLTSVVKISLSEHYTGTSDKISIQVMGISSYSIGENRKYSLSSIKTIDFPGDNVPPAIGNQFSIDSYATEIESKPLSDYGPSSYKGMTETYDITYWLYPFDSTWYGKYTNGLLSYQQLQNLGEGMHVTAHSDWETAIFPIAGSPSGTYLLVTKLADKNGNYYFDSPTAFTKGNYSSSGRKDSLTISNLTLNSGKYNLIAKFPYDAVYDKSNCSCDRNVYPNEVTDEHFLVKGYKQTDLFVECFDNGTGTMVKKDPLKIRSDSATTATTVTDCTANTFYRFQIKGTANKYNVAFSNPKYVYMNSNTTCTQKGVSFRSALTAYVRCDNACLVETVHSSFELTTEDDWDSFGVRSGAQLIKSDTTYAVDDNSLKAGDYYRVIVHYADGTRVMSEVRQK